MAYLVQWHSREKEEKRRNRNRWRNRKVRTKASLSAGSSIFLFVFRTFVDHRWNVPHSRTTVNPFDKLKFFWCSSWLASAILRSVTQITWVERVFQLVESYQHMFAPESRSHVRYEFSNTKTLVKKLARIEASSICRQQFANVRVCRLFLSRSHTPTWVCQL